MKKKLEMKKKFGIVAVVLMATAVCLGAFAPAVMAEGERAGKEGRLPPELQEYQGKIREALDTLREPLERVRALAAELKENRGAVIEALREKGEGAAEAFAEEIRAYLQDGRDVFGHLKEARAGMRGYRGLRRQVAQAVRDGDTAKAVEIIEGALARVEEARAGLEQLASDMEALIAEQAELLDAINGSSF